jgi:hypothetical protein
MSTGKELAARIDAHLRRFEADPAINTKTRGGTSRFYRAGSSAHGGWVSITYVTYQGPTLIRKNDAERYLAKLDAGFVGQHYSALRDEE